MDLSNLQQVFPSFISISEVTSVTANLKLCCSTLTDIKISGVPSDVISDKECNLDVFMSS